MSTAEEGFMEPFFISSAPNMMPGHNSAVEFGLCVPAFDLSFSKQTLRAERVTPLLRRLGEVLKQRRWGQANAVRIYDAAQRR